MNYETLEFDCVESYEQLQRNYEMDVPIMSSDDVSVQISVIIEEENRASKDIDTEKEVLIRRIRKNWNHVDRKLTGLSEKRLQRVYQIIKSCNF